MNETAEGATPAQRRPRYGGSWLATGLGLVASTPLPPEAVVIARSAWIDIIGQMGHDATWAQWWAHSKCRYLVISAWVMTDAPSRARPVRVKDDEIRYSPLLEVRDLLATSAAQQPLWARDRITEMVDRVRSQRRLPAMPDVPSARPLARELVASDMRLGSENVVNWEELGRLLPAESAERTVAAWSGHEPGDYRVFLDQYFNDDED